MLPNPSGLNAHYTLDALAAEFAGLRAALERGDSEPPEPDRADSEHAEPEHVERPGT